MSAGAGWAKLNKSMQTLREKWDGSEAEWRDHIRLEFGRDVIEPIELEVGATLRAIKRLEEELNRFRRDCGPSRDDY
jgi:hypothetical protein